MKIQKDISKAIKGSHWLSIEYQNKQEEITKYWIAIKDISIKSKSFTASAFNMSKMTDTHSGLIDEMYLFFDSIKSTDIIYHTTYEQPTNLIPKIETHLDELTWLGFDTYTESTLDYIYDCMLSEESPYQKESTLIKGIDQSTFDKIKVKEKYQLTYEQMADLVPKLEKLSKQEEEQKYEITTLALNLLSIHTRQGQYVVAYKNLSFNPIEKSLILMPEIKFNYTFTSYDGIQFKHNLRNYLDVETDEFLELYSKDEKAAKELLQQAIRKTESLDERPYVMDLVRNVYAYIEKEMDIIKIRQKENVLSTPLKAFFGNISASSQSGRMRNADVILIDHKANIDQLRVIYNALTKPITYVQGPPGTGKTQTILNTLLSAFFNGDTVLVSSDNNKPITDIYSKITNFKTKSGKMYLPFVRLGNREEVISTLNHLKDVLTRIDKFNVHEDALMRHAKKSSLELKAINKAISDYEKRIDLNEEIELLKSMKEKLNLELRGLVINQMIDQKEKELTEIVYVSDDEFRKNIRTMDESLSTWLFFTGVKHYKKILEPKNEPLLKIINSNAKDEIKASEFNKYLKDEDNFSNFQKIFPIILTTNKSVHRLGMQKELFDLVVIDEAGQSAIGHALFALARAKRLLLVGDQNQLKPVINIAAENNNALMKKYQVSDNYNYIDNSILLTMQKLDTVSKFVLLRYHYRSRKEIIDFSNKKYYNSQLMLPEKIALEGNVLEYIETNSYANLSTSDRNTATLEVEAIINDIKQKGYKNVGIITPFRNQANLIKESLEQTNLTDVSSGTIHTFQGDEKDIIYFSTAITKNTQEKSFDWVKNNEELINVATTRAKDKFIFVGDGSQIEDRSEINNDLYDLYRYVKAEGNEVMLKPSERTYFINGANYRNYDTKKEKEFFDTINHLLTTADKYLLESKVRIASILNKFSDNQKYDYALKGEFDLVIFRKVGNNQIPVVVIELDGKEHKEDEVVKKRDRVKEEICKDNKIELIRIDNKYSRRYVHIKGLLSKILT